MLRFANPGSDITSIIRIFIELYDSLRNFESFDLDDFTRVLINRNLATSCGYIGEEALERSTRLDRSRDPLFNQSKMYSEIFKILGWLHPTENSSLRFRFTYLGAHVQECKNDPVHFFSECILGIVYPNKIIRIRGDYYLRPFSLILKTLKELDGIINRDEMIIGPLCLTNDKDDSSVEIMMSYLMDIRKGTYEQLRDRLITISRNRNISLNTMRNYTRFPIAVLKWTGWANDERIRSYYNRSIPFLKLTEKGEQYFNILNNAIDIRESDLNNITEELKESLIKVSVFQMLERSGFDTSSVNLDLTQDIERVKSVYGQNHLLFSPFQELEPSVTSTLFPVSRVNNYTIQSHYSITTNDSEFPTGDVSIVQLSDGDTSYQKKYEGVIGEINNYFNRTNDIEASINSYISNIKEYNKDEYYPLVVDLFRVLGYKCEFSRVGVNYLRWDAIIIDDVESIPIEIKSPGEELFISVKAIRQALENKIILLSRESYPTTTQTSSLVVGFKLPNDRSDVQKLISDIYKTYELSIGVIDIYSLLSIASMTVLFNKKHNKLDIQRLRGIIDVSIT